jgi:NAD(P)H-dependent FMN reductase
MLSALAGKTAVICAASPGGLGGLRGLVHLRSILGNLGITVLPDQVAVSGAYQAFGEDGSLTDEKQADRVRKLGSTLADHLAKVLA